MSETQFCTGRIKKIDISPDLNGEELITWFKNQGFNIKDYEVYDGKVGYIDGDVVQLGNEYFHILKHYETLSEPEYVHAEKTEDPGAYRFTCMWHNGGASLEEVLEQAIKDARAREEDERKAKSSMEQVGSEYHQFEEKEWM